MPLLPPCGRVWSLLLPLEERPGCGREFIHDNALNVANWVFERLVRRLSEELVSDRYHANQLLVHLY
jgi:hypothetical protein